MVEEYDKDIEWIVKYNGTTTHKFEPDGRLVRCKDCEYYVCKPGYLINSIEDCMCYCKRIECGAVLIPVKDYDFCSRGIKRKEQENG